VEARRICVKRRAEPPLLTHTHRFSQRDKQILGTNERILVELRLSEYQEYILCARRNEIRQAGMFA
jgi:hypothetical protein